MSDGSPSHSIRPHTAASGSASPEERARSPTATNGDATTERGRAEDEDPVRETIRGLVDEMKRLRRTLHQYPELSGEEKETAARVVEVLSDNDVDVVLTGIAGHGVLAKVRGAGHDDTGPSNGRTGAVDLLLRADLDALPLREQNDIGHVSKNEYAHHACGHDGHIAMLVGALIALRRHDADWHGTVHGIFQPAEETGQGAKHVVEDPQWANYWRERGPPEAAFALHNIPGRDLGTIVTRRGPMAAASTGCTIHVTGATAHAAQPSDGKNPIPFLSTVLLRAQGLPVEVGKYGEASLVTPIELRAGRKAFGTAAGEGLLRLTLRTDTDEALEVLMRRLTEIAEAGAAAEGLDIEITRDEPFPATINTKGAGRRMRAAAHRVGLKARVADRPMPWSEDFAHLLNEFGGALAVIGSGNVPALHTKDYDFPDELLEPGMRFWCSLAMQGPVTHEPDESEDADSEAHDA